MDNDQKWTVERNHKGESCKISAAFETEIQTVLLHNYYTVILSIISHIIHIFYVKKINFRNFEKLLILKNHNFFSNLPFFTFVTCNHKSVIGRLFASAIQFLFRHVNPGWSLFGQIFILSKTRSFTESRPMTNRAANSPNSNFLVDRLSENTLFEKIKIPENPIFWPGLTSNPIKITPKLKNIWLFFWEIYQDSSNIYNF